MRRPQEVWCLLALVITGCHAGETIINLHGNDDGCNEVPHGIPCCEEKFVLGDNTGGEEMFIQADQYISSCTHTCKTLYPNSVGITESMSQQYNSGPGRYEQKCWCEFGRGKLDSRNHGYRTCMFKELSKPNASSPSNVSGTVEGENKDVGEDREIIMLDFKSIDVDNVNDSSHCCRACKDQKSVTDKARMAPMTVMVNFDKQKKQCSCFNTPTYGWASARDVERIALTRYNSEITSGLCDTNQETENSRRSGIYARHPTYHYSDVQGPLGEGYGFVTDNYNLNYIGDLHLDKTGAPLHHSSCCNECRKKYNDTEMFRYRGNKYDYKTKTLVPKERFVECNCMKVSTTGTRPVTNRLGAESHIGICEDIGPAVDCEIKPHGWSSWTDCSNLRKTCGRGFQSRYARHYQVARRGGKPCEQMDQVQSCEVKHCPPA